MTNWSIIAEPREDAADTEEILNLLKAAGFKRPEFSGGQSILGAEIRRLDFTPRISQVVVDTVDETFIREVEALIGLWPVIEAQMQDLLTAVYPVQSTSGKRPGGFGGTYGTRDQDVVNHFGQIYVTTDTAHGFAEGLISSLGNWKLYTMGIKTYEWDSSLITNTVDELVPAPLREEFKPVGVTLHALYAILHILEFNLKLIAVDDIYWAKHARFSIPRSADRIKRALAVFPEIKPTREGAQLLQGMQAWGTRLVREAQPWMP